MPLESAKHSVCGGGGQSVTPSLQSSLLLIGHGTRSDAGADQFVQLTDQVRRQLPGRLVEGCFLELQPPSIAEAWSRLVDQGAKHVHAVPLLLFAAGHAKRDIPTALNRCATESPGVTFDIGRALSRHRSVVQRSCQCVLDAVSAGVPGSPARSSTPSVLVMVGRGSYDVCAQADMRLFSETVFRTLGAESPRPFGMVETAFYAMAEPSLPRVLEAVCSRSDGARVVVQPHLLFTGQLQIAVERQVAEAQRRYPRCRLVIGQPLGPHPLVADAVCGRMLELERFRGDRQT